MRLVHACVHVCVCARARVSMRMCVCAHVCMQAYMHMHVCSSCHTFGGSCWFFPFILLQMQRKLNCHQLSSWFSAGDTSADCPSSTQFFNSRCQ